MPAAVACPKCKKKYTVPDHLLGKPVKCAGCGNTFKTAAAARAGTSAQHAPSPEAIAAREKAQALARQRAEGLKRLGIDSAIQTEPDIFAGATPARGPDPLANHMVEDPGFAKASGPVRTEEVADVEDEDPMAQMFVNPALASDSKKKNRSTGGKRPPMAMSSQPWLLLTVVFVPVFAALMGLKLGGILSPETAALLTTIACGLFVLACLAIYVWGLMLVYRTTPNVLQLLLCALVPFYIIYYIIIHWDDMKSFAYALIAQMLLGPLAGFALTVAGGSLATAS